MKNRFRYAKEKVTILYVMNKVLVCSSSVIGKKTDLKKGCLSHWIEVHGGKHGLQIGFIYPDF